MTLRLFVPVLISSMVVMAGPAAAAPPERSPLEAPEPVRTVTLRVDGSETLDDLAERKRACASQDGAAR